MAGLGSSIGNVGINTTVAEPPMEKLDVRGNLQIGLSGVDANLIKFYGTLGDGLGTGLSNPIGTHTVIGERRYDKQTKEEASELILFKGDNPDETFGPDRVRARAAEIVFKRLNHQTVKLMTPCKIIIHGLLLRAMVRLV